MSEVEKFNKTFKTLSEDEKAKLLKEAEVAYDEQIAEVNKAYDDQVAKTTEYFNKAKKRQILRRNF
jgi:hypothetical protein